jgi:hypothetical protein
MDITKPVKVIWGASNYEQPYVVDSTYGQFLVYDTDYKLYYHMAEADSETQPILPATLHESTDHQYHGTMDGDNVPTLSDADTLTNQQFDGSTDFATVPNNADFVPGASVDFIIEIRFRVNSTVGIQQLFNQEQNIGGGQWELRTDGTNIEAVLQPDGGASVTLNSTTVTSTGVWYTVMITRDLGDTIKLYVDGVEEDSDTLTGAMTNTGVLAIGTDFYHGGEWFNGDIEYIAFSKDTDRSVGYINTIVNNYDEELFWIVGILGGLPLVNGGFINNNPLLSVGGGLVG